MMSVIDVDLPHCDAPPWSAQHREEAKRPNNRPGCCRAATLQRCVGHVTSWRGIRAAYGRDIRRPNRAQHQCACEPPRSTHRSLWNCRAGPRSTLREPRSPVRRP